MKKHSYIIIVLCLLASMARAQDDLLQFVFTSDVHYGLFKQHFRGADSVASTKVNEAMIAAMNQLPGHIDALLITGDLANRAEKGIQSAGASWSQFGHDYFSRLKTHDAAGHPTRLGICAGNHDLANALGSWRPLDPAKDASSVIGMYNRMLKPAIPLTAATFDYHRDIVHYSFNIGKVHLLFVNLWPDSLEQQWMARDLDTLPADMPVLLFTHAMPDGEARFFTNPNGDHSINAHDKFENLLPEPFTDGDSVGVEPVGEQRRLVAFLKKHPAIKAWFHGHENFTEFYTWTGPDHDIALPCFRVDSPMKGRFSAKDEKLLSFETITIDPRAMAMTVREYFWNTGQWGQEKTMSLR